MGLRRSILKTSLFFALIASSVQAIELVNYFNLSGGWRHDRISTTIDAFAPNLTERDRINIKDIRVEEIGGKGRYTFYNDVYIRGTAYYGNVYGGRYHEKTAAGKERFSSFTTAKANRGTSEDVNVGFGYLYSWNKYFGIGPILGWSYNRLNLRMEHAKTDDRREHILDGLHYKNRWNGPWLGFDLMFRRSYFSLDAGYEYHWSHWRARWQLRGHNVRHVAFSDLRHSNHAWGNVVYLDGRWDFCPCWNIGFGLKAQDWRAVHGRECPAKGSFAKVGLPKNEIDKVKRTKWTSYSITFDVGYTF